MRSASPAAANRAAQRRASMTSGRTADDRHIATREPLRTVRHRPSPCAEAGAAHTDRRSRGHAVAPNGSQARAVREIVRCHSLTRHAYGLSCGQDEADRLLQPPTRWWRATCAADLHGVRLRRRINGFDFRDQRGQADIIVARQPESLAAGTASGGLRSFGACGGALSQRSMSHSHPTSRSFGSEINAGL